VGDQVGALQSCIYWRLGTNYVSFTADDYRSTKPFYICNSRITQ